MDIRVSVSTKPGISVNKRIVHYLDAMSIALFKAPVNNKNGIVMNPYGNCRANAG